MPLVAARRRRSLGRLRVKRSHPRIPAIVVLAVTAVAVLLLIVLSLRYPAIVRLPGAAIVLILTAIMLTGYAAGAVWTLRQPPAGQRTGLAFGVVAGAMWSAEIWCGGPGRLSHSAEQAAARMTGPWALDRLRLPDVRDSVGLATRADRRLPSDRGRNHLAMHQAQRRSSRRAPLARPGG